MNCAWVIIHDHSWNIHEQLYSCSEYYIDYMTLVHELFMNCAWVMFMSIREYSWTVVEYFADIKK